MEGRWQTDVWGIVCKWTSESHSAFSLYSAKNGRPTHSFFLAWRKLSTKTLSPRTSVIPTTWTLPGLADMHEEWTYRQHARLVLKLRDQFEASEIFWSQALLRKYDNDQSAFAEKDLWKRIINQKESRAVKSHWSILSGVKCDEYLRPKPKLPSP